MPGSIDEVSLCELRRLSTMPGGLGDSCARRKAWPQLLGVDRFKASSEWGSAHTPAPELRRQVESLFVDRTIFNPACFMMLRRQVELDVSRALHGHEATHSSGRVLSAAQKKRTAKSWAAKRAYLQTIIESVVSRSALKDSPESGPEGLHYYQGLHDVASVVLLVAEEVPRKIRSLASPLSPGPPRSLWRARSLTASFGATSGTLHRLTSNQW